MTAEEVTNYLDNLKERAREFGTARDEAARQGVDLLGAKEVGMLEKDLAIEDEDED